MRRRRLPWPVGLVALSLAGCNCGGQKRVTHVPENYTLVPGTPKVDPTTPTVQVAGQPPPVQYQINVPRQCDLFVQNTVRKVDILWVVDSSGSMAPHQAQLASNFQSFITFLLTADPPIDFHIGVVTTDTDDPGESGRLHRWSENGASASYIACDANHACNTASGGGDPTQSVQDAFAQMALQVGTQGSQVERGLYASYLALTRPDNIDTGSGGFVRSDAALYVVYVSDEDDSSCTPQVGAPTGPGDACRNDPGCHCADDDSLGFGTTAYFVRFLKSFKGYGHGDLVAAAAITGTDKNPVLSQFGDPNPHIGCQGGIDPRTGRQIVAYYGKRYITVASESGGVATSICASNFNNALSALGFAVSGLRREFKLSRGPDVGSLEVYTSPKGAAACVHDADCVGEAPYASCQAGKCAQSVSVSLQPDEGGAQYVRCESGVPRNIVRFGVDAIPPAQGTVDVCYNVDAHFTSTCQ